MSDYQHLSKATIARLPQYYRTFKQLQLLRTERVNSQELGKLTQIPAATIRHDFSLFGELGKSGYGYAVNDMVNFFGRLLGVEQEDKLILVGVGPLGQALLENGFRRNPNLQIVAAFDVDPKVIGRSINRVKVHAFQPMPTLPEGVHSAIIAVPSAATEAVVKQLEAMGVDTILSFAPQMVNVKPTTTIRYVDLTSEVQTLLFTARWRHH